MDKSGHGRNPSEQGALTNWRAQTDRQVRTQKKSEQVRGLRHSHPGEQTDSQVRAQRESERPRGTHVLESADGQSGQDIEGIRVSKGHSLPGEHRQTDRSGHGRSPSKRGALTSWRAQTDRQTGQGTERIRAAKGTHVLESADGRTSNKINKTPGHTKRRTDVILNVFCEPESLLNTG